MGYVNHGAVLVTSSGYATQPDVEAFRKSLPEEWQPLVVGPIESVTNGYVSYAFLPDGSKEGWDTSDMGDKYRHQFAMLFNDFDEDRGTPYDVVEVEFGGDEPDLMSIADPR